MSDKLPKTLPELIRVAVRDLEAAEQSIMYHVDMYSWHEPKTGLDHITRCHVCLAGAVIAKSLGMAVTKHVYPEDIGGDDAYALRALDDIRSGDVTAAYNQMGHVRVPFNLRLFNHPAHPGAYEEDPEAFKRNLNKLADRLERAERNDPMFASAYVG